MGCFEIDRQTHIRSFINRDLLSQNQHIMQLLAPKSSISSGFGAVSVKSMCLWNKPTSSRVYTPPPFSPCTCLPPYAPLSVRRKHHRYQWQQVRLLQTSAAICRLTAGSHVVSWLKYLLLIGDNQLWILELMTELEVITSSMNSFWNWTYWSMALPRLSCMQWSPMVLKTTYCNITDWLPFTAASLCSITAPLLLSLPLLLLLLLWMLMVINLVTVLHVACVWMWVLCPELMSVTIRTQPNSTACSRRFQAASSPEQVRAQKSNYSVLFVTKYRFMNHRRKMSH